MCSYFQQLAARKKSSQLERQPIIGLKSDELTVIRPTLRALTIDSAGEATRHWALVPSWAKDSKLKFATFNARAESLVSKPAFRDAWRRAQRCLIPAVNYSEYPVIEGKKQRHNIALASDQELMLAGLWSDWQRDDEIHPSFTMITTAPLPQIEWVHARSPLMLAEEHWDRWLNGSPESCLDLLMPQDPGELTVVNALA